MCVHRVNCVVSSANIEASKFESTLFSFQLLTPKRRVDILRDIAHAKSESRPYVIVFCGVNGVGKSTNLAKVYGSCADYGRYGRLQITFWLNENGHRVLIAAGDTFR